MGSVLLFQPAGAAPLSVYVTGDTLVVDDLREVPAATRTSTSGSGTSAAPGSPACSTSAPR